MKEKVLQSVTDYLQSKYNCHTIIVYGSYVTGDYTEESDIDIICFTDNPPVANDTSKIHDVQLDAWIYQLIP